MVKIVWNSIYIFLSFSQIKKKRAKSTLKQASFPWILSLYVILFFQLREHFKSQVFLSPWQRKKNEKCFWPKCFLPRFDAMWAGGWLGWQETETFNQWEDWGLSQELNFWVDLKWLNYYPMVCWNFSCASTEGLVKVVLCAEAQKLTFTEKLLWQRVQDCTHPKLWVIVHVWHFSFSSMLPCHRKTSRMSRDELALENAVYKILLI